MFKRFIVLTLLLILSACNNSLSDLDEFMAHIKSKPPKPIEPLPEINTPQQFEYVAGNARDPFSNDLEIATEQELARQEVIPEGLGPDLTRRKEFLETYPLDSMVMVGTYQQGEEYWSLIIDPEGTVHRASVGDYLGHNYGEIITVRDSEIVIKEWTNDGLGAWRERKASMALRED
ncbi:MAG: pilus assembly protein PilP [Proteobacteria bacterium]|nr:pilus assembly protein PilP [Pseudomonadota bacterium]